MECLYSELAAQVVAVERACESASQQLDTTNLQSPTPAERKRLKNAKKRASRKLQQQQAAEAEREKAKTDEEEQRVQSIH